MDGTHNVCGLLQGVNRHQPFVTIPLVSTTSDILYVLCVQLLCCIVVSLRHPVHLLQCRHVILLPRRIHDFQKLAQVSYVATKSFLSEVVFMFCNKVHVSHETT